MHDDSQHCECPVCEEPWGKNYYDKDQPEVWRFEAHSRPYLDRKGKLVKGVGCPGGGKSLDEAWEIKHYLDARGGSSQTTREHRVLVHHRRRCRLGRLVTALDAVKVRGPNRR